MNLQDVAGVDLRPLAPPPVGGATTVIYFQPASQVDNVGDLLINLSLLDIVRPFGDVVLNDLDVPETFVNEIASDRDVRFSAIAGERFYRFLFKRLVKDRLSSSASRRILLYPPGHSARAGWRAALVTLVWYSKLLVLKMLGCRIIRAGFSIGPFDRANALVESFGSRCFTYYGVRDSASYGIGKRYRFGNLDSFPDLAWTYAPKNGSGLAEPNRSHVVLSFRSNTYGESHDAAYLSPIVRHVEHLMRSTELGTFRLVIAYQVKSDRQATEQIAQALSPEFDVEIRHEQLALSDAEKLYSTAHCVLTNRLHVMMLASQCGAMVIPVIRGTDNVKITSILDDNMLSSYCIDTTRSLEANVEKLTRALERRDEFRTLFARASARNLERADSVIRRLFRDEISTEAGDA